MEALWPLHDKAPELVQSHLCHILLDKTHHKANTDSRVREIESTSGWEACHATLQSTVHTGIRGIIPNQLQGPPLDMEDLCPHSLWMGPFLWLRF